MRVWWVCSYLYDLYQMTLITTKKKWTLTILTGIFDGVQMTTNDNSWYPVPSNYASKSMLVPWDMLKLVIEDDGTLVYKLIKCISRKHIRGIVHKKENQFFALWSDNQNYKLNTASVTFHKAKCGDEVWLVINPQSDYTYAALETVLKD